MKTNSDIASCPYAESSINFYLTVNAKAVRKGFRQSIMNPYISIIVPIYNVEKYLEQCLSSIAAQTFKEIEVLCVNDGSTDGSLEIMHAFASKDERFKVVNKPNGGYGSGVNAGVANAAGKYIGIVEPDDYIEPNMYEALSSAAEKNPGVDIVKSAYWRVLNADAANEEIKPANYLHRIKKVGQPFKLKDDAEFLYHHPSIWSAIYKCSFLEQQNIKMPEIPGAGWADNPWMMETLVKASSIVYIDECLYFYRESIPGSSSLVKDPTIIYERWFDMDRIIKANHVTSPTILEGHYNRGCAYIKALVENFGTNQPETKAAIKRMVSLIDAKAVERASNIPPKYKQAFFEAKSPFAWTAYRAKKKLGL